MDLGLSGRTYVLTGASGGLGLATAQALVADGAQVVVSSRTRESVDAAVATLGERAVGVVADNADPDTPGRLIAAARESFGGLDGALVSVGGPPAGSIMDSTDEQWIGAFESVFLGAIRLAPRGGCRAGRGWRHLVRAVHLGQDAGGRAGHQQRPAARTRDGRQDPGR